MRMTSVVLVGGTREHAETVRDEAAAVLQPMGLRLSAEKTKIAHIDEGFDFLGFRIRRDRKRGAEKRFVYTYPSKSALAGVKGKVRTLTQRTVGRSLTVLLVQLNRTLRGWTNHFRYGVSKATFGYLRAFTWRRVLIWLSCKHPRRNWGWLRRHYLPGRWPTEGETKLFDPSAVAVTRYRYRANRIPSPWATLTMESAGSSTA